MHFAAKAVIFDLDGVLADSTSAVDESWRVWAQRHQIEPQFAIHIGFGRPTIAALRILQHGRPDLDIERSLTEMEALEESFIDRVVPLNGAPQFVQRVIELGMPWAVVTSGTRRIAVPRLQRAQIPEPPVLITSDDVTHGKPHPEPYEKAARMLNVDPVRCVVFEDSPNGRLSARRAGAKVIGIDDRRKPEYCDDAVIDFEDVVLTPKTYIKVVHSRFRCRCCDCHTLRTGSEELCALCKWENDEQDYSLSEARENVAQYGVKYRPSDVRFARIRHAILGPNGEYAIDRVALRDRAYREFRRFGEGRGDRTRLSGRLEALLAAIEKADCLYRPSAL